MNNSVDTAPPFLPYKERTSAYISALDTNLVSFYSTVEAITRQFEVRVRQIPPLSPSFECLMNENLI